MLAKTKCYTGEAFADDLTLLAKTRKVLAKTVRRIVQKGYTFGLRVNQEKMKYMIMGDTQQSTENCLQVQTEEQTYTLEKVQHFTYLKLKISENGHKG